jgi:hypothetical protein
LRAIHCHRGQDLGDLGDLDDLGDLSDLGDLGELGELGGRPCTAEQVPLRCVAPSEPCGLLVGFAPSATTWVRKAFARFMMAETITRGGNSAFIFSR